MESPALERAVDAAIVTATALGLPVDDVEVLHSSNRIAVHLSPCDTVARVGPPSWHEGLAYEVEIAHRLSATGAPVGGPDPRAEPRVFVHGGFSLTLWTYHQPVPPAQLTPAEYASALARLHAGMRELDVRSPHFTDRVADALEIVGDRALSPALADADRELLGGVLRSATDELKGHGGSEQLLHGEPHVGNVLRTGGGLRFIDLETCCRGPVEFDMAHGLLPSSDGSRLDADALVEHYPAADPRSVDLSLTLIWAMITTWRWHDGDELPNRDHWRLEGLHRLRVALGQSDPTASA